MTRSQAQAPRVFLLPPPDLPVPAVEGGAVETLITHLIEENERQGLLRLECASIPHPAAAAEAAGWRNTKMHWIAPPPAALRRLYGPWRGLMQRLGRLERWPQNPWYLAAARRIRAAGPAALVAEGGNLTEPARILARTGLGRDACLAHLHMQTAPTPFLQRAWGGVLGISGFVLERWQDGGLPCAKHLVYNCVDLARFCPAPAVPAAPEESRAAVRAGLGFAEEDFVILFCGRICPEKGVHRLLRAMPLLPEAFKLLIVGSPFFAAEDTSPFFEQLKRLAAPLTASGRVRFTGFVPNRRLPEYYRAADAACLPAEWDEPAGITAIEAMACGCPVVATRSGGMPEYLAGSGAVLLERDELITDDGRTQPLPGVPPLEGQIAAALAALAGDAARRAEMSALGVQRAQDFGREGYYRQFCRALGAGG